MSGKSTNIYIRPILIGSPRIHDRVDRLKLQIKTDVIRLLLGADRLGIRYPIGFGYPRHRAESIPDTYRSTPVESRFWADRNPTLQLMD